jgi:hypothetical protein
MDQRPMALVFFFVLENEYAEGVGYSPVKTPKALANFRPLKYAEGVG